MNPERLIYEFAGFQVNAFDRSLSYQGEARCLRPIAFELLLVLLENRGKSLSKAEIIKYVWGIDSGDDRNFHVTLHAVRQALGESGRTASFIVRDAIGYRFATDVRIVSMENHGDSGVRTFPTTTDVKEEDSLPADTLDPYLPHLRKHRVHVFAASLLYGALYAIALILEVSYEFDRFGAAALKIAPLVLVWITTTSMVGLTIDRKLTLQGRSGGLTASGLISLGAAAVLLGVLTRFLPDFAITKANFQTYPVQAAYLKDVSYFILLALVFLIVPFHSIAAIEHEVQQRRSIGAYPRPWALTLVLIAIAAIALIMTAHLLDNLRPGSYMNLFTQLVYLRGILYFGLGIVCLWWYYRRLNAIKSFAWQRKKTGGVRTYAS